MASSYIRSILQGLTQNRPVDTALDSEPISAHKLTATAGTWYEKIRYMVDYQEERTIKRNAIERILKRKLIFEGQRDIGVTLIHELVSGGYVTSGSVSEEKASHAQAVVDKYLALLDQVREGALVYGKTEKIIVSFAATEIYRFLFPAPVDALVVEAFYAKVSKRIEYTPALHPLEADTQTYIGCRRAFLKESDNELFYALWLRRFPAWAGEETTLVVDAAETIREFRVVAKEQIEHPLGFRVTSRLKDYGIYFTFVKEIVEHYGVQAERVFDDTMHLEGDIKDSLTSKYSQSYSQAKKSGIRAVIYILCTKILLAFALEVPYDLWFVGVVNYVALGINVIFHPLLLLFMTNTIKPLGDENTKRILKGVALVSSDEEIPLVRVRNRTQFSGWNFFFFIIYGALFLFTFGIIVEILQRIGFNIVSILLFLFFLTLVSYFGLRIRHNSREWMVSGDTQGTWKLLWDLFTFPIIRVGKYLSQKFSAINVFVLLLDFIIETPFKLILSVLDSFLAFVKEKHEEIM